jgi:thiol-disulfide isomerase/thioredoxin
VTLAVLALGALLAAGVQESPPKEILGKKAPDFTLPSFTDSKLRLSSLKGKIVVLDFWAVWCGPCTDSMPFFQKLQDKYGSQGLEVVGLHVNDRVPEAEEVKDFLEELGVNYKNVLSTTEVDDLYLVYAMPTTYIVDRDGVLRKRHIGFNPATAPARIERDVKELLSR